MVKVPRTGHSVVFDESITQVETVIQAMADDFAATYGKCPVEVEVIVFEQNQYDEAVAGTFGTDKAPDVLYGDYFNTSTYVHTGRVVPLDDIIAPDLRADVSDYLWDASTVEGRVYLMPYLARQNVLGYSKELFRRRGWTASSPRGALPRGRWTSGPPFWTRWPPSCPGAPSRS